MKYYQQIELNNLEIIKSKVLDILNNDRQSHDFTHVYHPEEWSPYLEIPELIEELKRLCYYDYVFTIAIFVVIPDSPAPIHHDIGYKYSLNLPIQGCENTEVGFYVSSRPALEKRTVNGGKRFYQYEPEFCNKVDGFDMSTPAILNTSEPHNITNNNPIGSLPRVTLLIRLKETVGELF